MYFRKLCQLLALNLLLIPQSVQAKLSLSNSFWCLLSGEFSKRKIIKLNKEIDKAQEIAGNWRRRGGRARTLNNAEAKRLEKLINHQLTYLDPKDLKHTEVGDLFKDIHRGFFDVQRATAELSALKRFKAGFPVDPSAVEELKVLIRKDEIKEFEKLLNNANRWGDEHLKYLNDWIDARIAQTSAEKLQNTIHLYNNIDLYSAANKTLRDAAALPDGSLFKPVEDVAELDYDVIKANPKIRNKSVKMRARETLARLQASWSMDEYWKSYGVDPHAFHDTKRAVDERTKKFFDLVLGKGVDFKTPSTSSIHGIILDDALDAQLVVTRQEAWREFWHTIATKFPDRKVAPLADDLMKKIGKLTGIDLGAWGLRESIMRNTLRAKYYDDLDAVLDGALSWESALKGLMEKNASYDGKLNEFLQVAFMRGDTRPDLNSILTKLNKKIAGGKPANKMETYKDYKKLLEAAKKQADEANFTMPAAYEPMSSETARMFLTPVYALGASGTTWLLNKLLSDKKQEAQDVFNRLSSEQQEKLIEAIEEDEVLELLEDN